MAPFTAAKPSGPSAKTATNFVSELVASVGANLDLSDPEKEQLGIFL